VGAFLDALGDPDKAHRLGALARGHVMQTRDAQAIARSYHRLLVGNEA
jgi:hypothetical protein